MYKVYVIDTPIYSDDEHFFQSSQACTPRYDDNCIKIENKNYKIKEIKDKIKTYFSNEKNKKQNYVLLEYYTNKQNEMSFYNTAKYYLEQKSNMQNTNPMNIENPPDFFYNETKKIIIGYDKFWFFMVDNKQINDIDYNTVASTKIISLSSQILTKIDDKQKKPIFTWKKIQDQLETKICHGDIGKTCQTLLNYSQEKCSNFEKKIINEKCNEILKIIATKYIKEEIDAAKKEVEDAKKELDTAKKRAVKAEKQKKLEKAKKFRDSMGICKLTEYLTQWCGSIELNENKNKLRFIYNDRSLEVDINDKLDEINKIIQELNTEDINISNQGGLECIRDILNLYDKNYIDNFKEFKKKIVNQRDNKNETGHIINDLLKEIYKNYYYLIIEREPLVKQKEEIENEIKKKQNSTTIESPKSVMSVPQNSTENLNQKLIGIKTKIEKLKQKEEDISHYLYLYYSFMEEPIQEEISKSYEKKNKIKVKLLDLGSNYYNGVIKEIYYKHNKKKIIKTTKPKDKYMDRYQTLYKVELDDDQTNHIVDIGHIKKKITKRMKDIYQVENRIHFMNKTLTTSQEQCYMDITR